MELQCNNCKHGPCKTESNIGLEFVDFRKELCNFHSTVANWELIPEQIETKTGLSPNPWKDPEKMTLQEAWKKASRGETLFCVNYKIIKDEKKLSKYIIPGLYAISDHWQIIPAEPKVLTAYDYWLQSVPTITNKTESFPVRRKPDIINAFNSGDENGQLKEWLNHKELRETAEDFTQQFIGFLSPSIVREYQDRLKALLDKLKEAK